MGINFFQVDSFTDKPFQGNPAAVCISTVPVSDEWMQNIACEMNLSETAFLIRQNNGYNLRWFTPITEVNLCGHATLASAHILWSENYLSKNQEAKFYTKSGLLTATKQNGWIKLNFPAEPDSKIIPPSGLLQALGVRAEYVGMNRFDYLIEVESEQIVRGMNPDFNILKKFSHRGVIVTAKSDSGDFDFVSRYFDPAEGINEDPVTGSAHCCLGPYWRNKMSKKKFIAYQASQRGGTIKVEVEDERERVYLYGQAITVLKGEIIS